jgi:hypothetical protein
MQMSESDKEKEKGSEVTPRIKMFRIPGLSSTEKIFLCVCKSRKVLPDGIFSIQKSQFGKNFVGLWNEKVWYIYSMAIWNMILRPFGTFYGHLASVLT